MSVTPRCAPATRRRMVRWWLGFPDDGRSVAQAPGNCGPIPPGGELIPLAFPDLRMSVERLVEGELVAYLGEELQRAGRSLAKYPHALGYSPLREWLAARLAATRGFSVDADAILLGSGSNEANFLVAQALLDPGDVVLAEEFTYAGTLGFLRRFGADIRGVKCDGDGMLPDSLEYQIQAAIDDGRRPKAVYTIPTFQNPLGFVESLQRREAVTDITARYGVPVWEDDCYVDLNFEHPDLPPAIRSLDDSGRTTIYVASFSKNIAPGMRLGYVTAPPPLMDRIAAIKGTGGVSEFTAMAVYRFAQTGLDAHIERARARLQQSATRCWRRWNAPGRPRTLGSPPWRTVPVRAHARRHRHRGRRRTRRRPRRAVRSGDTHGGGRRVRPRPDAPVLRLEPSRRDGRRHRGTGRRPAPRAGPRQPLIAPRRRQARNRYAANQILKAAGVLPLVSVPLPPCSPLQRVRGVN